MHLHPIGTIGVIVIYNANSTHLELIDKYILPKMEISLFLKGSFVKYSSNVSGGIVSFSGLINKGGIPPSPQ